MLKIPCRLALLSILMMAGLMSAPADEAKIIAGERHAEISATARTLFWQQPTDVQNLDLVYGPGGKEHQPTGPFTFLEEDMDGTSPKFDIVDQDKVRWKVKLGPEAQPEVAATRFVWAMGYFTDEDYFLNNFQVANMPKLRRGADLVGPDGTIRAARLERHLKGQDKIGFWKWKSAPFKDTREFNGLRVLLAMINDWDVKDVNNAIYDRGKRSDEEEIIYAVGDLGASFGTAGYLLPRSRSRGNLKAYRESRFVTKVTPTEVTFKTPARPTLLELLAPPQFIKRVRLGWIGHDIPRADARWMGKMLGRLSPEQIRDAFRTSGYSAAEVEGFAAVVEHRIAQLNEL